jgi:predicted Zn-dependent protease
MMRSLLPLCATLLLTACVTNPYTNRSQLMLVSEAEETQMGVEGYAQVMKDEPVNTDADINAPLQRVGKAIAAAADAWRAENGEAPYEWEFKLIANDEMVNAWCMPGGKIAFYTGIYPILEDEAGMAIVMGHEVSHAMLRHGGERMSQNIAAGVGLTAAGILAADSEYRDIALAAIGAGVTVGVLLPYSRDHESEADFLGLQLAARAGYDPREGVRIWENMSKLGGAPAELLSTHPKPETRIQQMKEWMPEMMAIYERSQKMPNAPLPDAKGRGPVKKKAKKAAEEQGASAAPRRRR